PYDLAAHVKERPARVAGVDGNVSLYELRIVGLAAGHGASGGAHDACGDAVLESEGRADRDDPLAGVELRVVVDLPRRQVLRPGIERRYVRLLVQAYELGCVLAKIV